MATSKIENNKIYTGFHIIDLNTDGEICKYFNEAYTEIVKRRYFDGDECGYETIIQIVKKVEKLIGKRKMEKLYFNNDINSFIAELSKYNKPNKILKFFYDIDSVKELENLIHYTNISKMEKIIVLKKLLKSSLNVDSFLDECFKEKNNIKQKSKVFN